MRRMALAGALAVALLAGPVAPAAQTAPRPAPPFSLELFDGRTLSLESLKGRAVILLFWAPW